MKFWRKFWLFFFYFFDITIHTGLLFGWSSIAEIIKREGFFESGWRRILASRLARTQPEEEEEDEPVHC